MDSDIDISDKEKRKRRLINKKKRKRTPKISGDFEDRGDKKNDKPRFRKWLDYLDNIEDLEEEIDI